MKHNILLEDCKTLPTLVHTALWDSFMYSILARVTAPKHSRTTSSTIRESVVGERSVGESDVSPMKPVVRLWLRKPAALLIVALLTILASTPALAALFGVTPTAITAAVSPPTPTAQHNANTDKAALVAVYNSTNGRQWQNKTNWITAPNIGDWHGVTTDANGRVTRLELLSNNLTGTIPSEIGQLTELTHLNFYTNNLIGTIPSEIGQLTELTHLELDRNALTGTVPSEIGQLTNLTFLELDNNNLTGIIPPEIGKLIKLTHMEFDKNNLTGIIPPEIGKLIKLTYLDLDNNDLIGTIPDISKLVDLILIELDDNNLTGPIPSEITQFDKLMVLRLDNNRLTGPIPADIGKLTKLLLLDLHNNNLYGTVPVEIGKVGMSNNHTTVNLTHNLWICYNTRKPTRFSPKLTITGWPTKRCPENFAPSAPTLVADDTSLLVFWSRSSLYNSTNKYDIQYLKKGETTWATRAYTGTDTTTTITGLDNTGTYIVRIRSTDPNLGNSDWSLPRVISMATGNTSSNRCQCTSAL